MGVISAKDWNDAVRMKEKLQEDQDATDGVARYWNDVDKWSDDKVEDEEAIWQRGWDVGYRQAIADRLKYEEDNA